MDRASQEVGSWLQVHSTRYSVPSTDFRLPTTHLLTTHLFTIHQLTTHPKTSFTTSPPSTILIGRPMLLMFSLEALIARPWQIVRKRSATLTGRFFTDSPPASSWPITCPPFTPPPARAALKARG